jgi:ATP-dependent Lon protease
MDMPLPISQKNNILKQYTNLINSRFSENKLKTWFDSVMTIPFNVYKGINLKTMKTESSKRIKKFLNKLQEVMDNAVYGHDDAKRQIIQTMGQHIRNPTAKGTVLGLWGPMGNGKCFAADTPILMYDGHTKKVQDVKVGDVLMGDDSKPRNVLSLGSGQDEMYEIMSKNESYTVNSEHILCLKETNSDKVTEITVRDYLKLSDDIKKGLKGYKTGVDFPSKKVSYEPYAIGLWLKGADAESIPDEYKVNDRQIRLKLLAGLIDSDGYYNKENKCFEITQKSNILSDDILFICRSLGFASYKYKKDDFYQITIQGKKLYEIPTEYSCKIDKDSKDILEDVLLNDINVVSKGFGNYYGFMIDGNERFVLGNFTVTHNTTLIKEGIAKAMDKPFVFISLGGATDASFLEGHSYTYEGSIYGRIMNGIIASKCMDPIIYFDELDKISKTPKGEEIVNLLIHLTDPAQNNHFRDKYFHGIDIDLSRATMIFSFNDPSRVNPILLDRITTVETKFLMTTQKIHIAQNYLIPEMMKDMGLEKDYITINDDVLRYIIDSYTREGGVRKLKALLYMIVRELNLASLLETEVEDDLVIFPFDVKFKHIKTLLKNKTIIDPDTINDVSKPGVINGLYATSMGVGGVLPIEILKMPATRPYEIKTTGNLEKVIKESTEVASTLAFNCLDKKLQDKYASEWKKKPYGFHIHCPEGATPKDGPSAGTALTVALYSMLTGMKVRNDIAITGEINLQGKVTAIGGLENKLEGAKKTGVKLVLCPKENQKHLDKIKERNPTLIDDNFKVITVETIDEAFSYSLVD